MADPTMVTDDLIRTRQAIFQQPDWLKACEMNMALQDLETRKRNMLTDDDLRAIQAAALVLWTTKDPSGPVDEGQAHRLADPERPARGHGQLRSLAPVRGHRHLQPDPPRLPARPQRPGQVSSAVTLALLAMSHSPLLEHAELDAEVSGELEAAFAEARRFVHDFDPDVIVNFAPDHYNGFFYRLMPPFCIGYAAESIGDYGSQTGRLDVPEDLARALAEAVIGDGIDLAVSLDMQVDHGAVQPIEIVYGDITRQAVRPDLHQLRRPAVHAGAAGPAARRGDRPPPRHPGQEGPAHLLRRPVARPARAADGHRDPRPAAAC